MIESATPKFECHCNHEVPGRRSTIVFHRNHLHHYRHCYKELDGMFKQCASVDIDFSENFTVPVKFEPQSLHCCHQQVTVHSGILK